MEHGGQGEHEEGSRRWGAWVLAVVALGVVVRAAYVLVVLDDVPAGADAIWYQLQGGAIREGYGYVVPRTLFTGELLPTAAFPPLYPGYQAAWHLVVGRTPGPDAVRLAGLLPAAVTIALTAGLGRRVGGPRIGLVAAALVALHPGLIAADGSAMSESLTVPLALGAQLLALRLATTTGGRTRLALALGLGAVLGLAVLTRQDLVLLAVVLVGWLLVVLPGSARAKASTGLVVGLASLAVVAPWVWRNHQALDVVAVSTISPTSAIAGANCASTYAGPDLGSWDYDCVVAARPSAATEDELLELGITEAELMDAYQRAAIDHARADATRLPLVLTAREARAWSFWDPADLARRDADESRRYGWQLVARPLEAVVAVVGFAGLVGLLRRRAPAAFVLLAPVLAVIASVALGYGNPRFNVIAQPSLLIAAAWLVATLASTRWPRLRPAEPTPAEPAAT